MIGIAIPVEIGIPKGTAAGTVAGYQIFDPETEALIEEGSRTALPEGAGKLAFEIQVPAESGMYRVYVSLLDEERGWAYTRNEPFSMLDVEVDLGRAVNITRRVTTLRALRRGRLRGAATKALTLPFQTIWRNRALIRTMVRRDILGRYRGSFGGGFWTLLSPLLLMLTYFFVFGVVLEARAEGDPSRSGFALYFLAGMLPWLAFSDAASRAPFIVLEHRNFVKKLVFAIETVPFNIVVAGLVSEAFGIALYIAGHLITKGTVHPTMLWLPVLIIPQVLFTTGLCWFLAGLGVFVRDVGQVIGFAMTLWFFLTPICYPESKMPAFAAAVLYKNPLYVLVRGYRAILLEGQAPDWHSLWKLWVLALVVFLAGHAWFYKLRKSFADVI